MTGRRIAIVGAGQAGIQLALGLQHHGHQVSLVTDRAPASIRAGAVMATSCLFAPALEVEDNADLPTWEAEAPTIGDLDFTLTGPQPVHWRTAFDSPARSVDLRLKYSAWLDLFQSRGGTLRIESMTVAATEELAATHDLTIVATGKGEVGSLFPTDHSRTAFTTPQRTLAVALVTGAAPDQAGAALHLAVDPAVGEFLSYPMLTERGIAQVMMFEGRAGTDLARRLEAITDADDHLATTLELLGDHFPSQAGRFAGARLLDETSVARGRVTPVVRQPVGTLPSGRTVLGLGTAVVATDPIASQPSNNATLAADFYLDAILRRGEREFDAGWQRRTFEAFWRGWAKWAVLWTNSVLEDLTAHQRTLLTAAGTVPGVAQAVANSLEDPRTAYRWWFEAADAAELISRSAAEARGPVDPRDFRAALGQYATGVAVVTTRDADGVCHGMTANSFTSVSIDPPLILWCPSKRATSLPAFAGAEHFAVNILADAQHHLSRQFSVSGSPEKFAGVEYTDGLGGAPVLAGALASFECRRVAVHDAGDHDIHVGQVERYSWAGGEPLLFHDGRFHVTRPRPES
ncbi:flavin reductase [Georgenia ruanii]|uniref:flavin reductase n=1 Tax=Georgenia ruanii TaxID=348442 RepID=UPI001D027E44|nr:flavin reductase [Georgenia ruanii]